MIRYTREHQYVRLDGDRAVVGITPHAQEQLGDIVHVELPRVGRTLGQGEAAAVVESVKAANEVFAPVSGAVASVNDALLAAPEAVNDDPTGQGWFFTLALSDPAELDDLMDEAAYRAFVGA
jgi:glycine cleavage system H protein